MSSNNAAMEAALLDVAKDLLQASDDLASTDPSASAKLAHEAYEIGRDLGVVRNHLGEENQESIINFEASPLHDETPLPRIERDQGGMEAVEETVSPSLHAEDVTDDDLFRILDRQKAMLPTAVELTPSRTPGRGHQSLTFESAPSRRSGWFGWMRSREWRHAG